MSTYSDDLALALQLADAADLISMSRYQSQDLVVTTKPLITKVERCKDNQQIIWVVRDWLREEGYGERQYIASSITKKRTRGWSTMEP